MSKPAAAGSLPENPVARALEKHQEQHGFGEADAVLVWHQGREVFSFGKIDKPMYAASVRKSLISLLFGIAAGKGLIDLDATIGSLGIDESRTPLTEVEKGATVRNLLEARSGVYIESSGETGRMKDLRPTRGQYRPGEHFYYNNWDFNVLGTIFETRTQLSLGNAFDTWLAQPLGMQHFRPRDISYRSATDSDYRQYMIHISASDLARVGQLVLQDGLWQGQRLIEKQWIDESTATHSRLDTPDTVLRLDGYGYLWWLDSTSGRIWAIGWGGQYLIIDPQHELVVVLRNDTGRGLAFLMFLVWGEELTRQDAMSVADTAARAVELR